jgi:hydroxyethylthiazole kinase-like uncharacterized protein yjeF
MAFAPIYLTADIRAIEASAGASRLMERAGLAAAEHAGAIMGERSRAVLLVAGPGNNGGDAFEVAAHLKRRFYRVETLLLGDSGRLSGDARAAFGKWQSAGGECIGEFPGDAAQRFGLIVDGLFGTGLARPLEGVFADTVQRMNGCGLPILALDVPSGINADTGAVMGAAVRAAHTITFIALKPGLLTSDGPDHCGALRVDALGLDAEALRPPPGRLLSADAIREALAPRRRSFHKGDAGNVAVLGGARGMVGAALLAGRAALKCGAGRVYLGLLAADAPLADEAQPELMLRPAADAPLDDAVLAAGPGMGQDAQARALLERALSADSPAVLDADALNLIAADAGLAALVAARRAPTIMTPHPAEAARLLACGTREVQADRIAAACAIAARHRALVALKGNGTVVAEPGGGWWINPTGHAGMASAGMGDALTGIVAGLLAQGAGPRAALTAGVWLHGAAGDAAAAVIGGPLGTTASDVIEQARAVLNRELYR